MFFTLIWIGNVIKIYTTHTLHTLLKLSIYYSHSPYTTHTLHTLLNLSIYYSHTPYITHILHTLLILYMHYSHSAYTTHTLHTPLTLSIHYSHSSFFFFKLFIHNFNLIFSYKYAICLVHWLSFQLQSFVNLRHRWIDVQYLYSWWLCTVMLYDITEFNE